MTHVSYLIVNKSSAGFNNDDEDADYDDIIKRSLIMKKLNSSELTRHLRGSYLVQSETSDLISLFGSSWRHSREGSGADNDNKNDIDKRFQSFHSCYFSAAGSCMQSSAEAVLEATIIDNDKVLLQNK